MEKKAELFMYLAGYDRDLQKNCNTGWGCGYVAIPKDSKVIKDWQQRLEKDRIENPDNYHSEYFTPGDIDQEITYTEEVELEGDLYIVIGFDTAHIYNGPSHNFKYVFDETRKIMNRIKELSQ